MKKFVFRRKGSNYKTTRNIVIFLRFVRLHKKWIYQTLLKFMKLINYKFLSPVIELIVDNFNNW